MRSELPPVTMDPAEFCLTNHLNGDDSPALRFCRFCRKAMCETCYNNHKSHCGIWCSQSQTKRRDTVEQLTDVQPCKKKKEIVTSKSKSGVPLQFFGWRFVRHLSASETNTSVDTNKYSQCTDHLKDQDQFCTSHCTVICQQCHCDSHKLCSVISVVEACSQLNDTSVSEFRKWLNKIRVDCIEVKNLLSKNVTSLEKQKHSAIKELKKLYDQAIDKLNLEFADSKTEIESKHDKHTSEFCTNMCHINRIMSNLDTNLKDAKMLENLKMDVSLFLKFQTIFSCTNELPNDLQKIFNNLSKIKLMFKGNKRFQPLSPKSKLGCTSITTTKYSSINAPTPFVFPKSVIGQPSNLSSTNTSSAGGKENIQQSVAAEIDQTSQGTNAETLDESLFGPSRGQYISSLTEVNVPSEINFQNGPTSPLDLAATSTCSAGGKENDHQLAAVKIDQTHQGTNAKTLEASHFGPNRAQDISSITGMYALSEINFQNVPTSSHDMTATNMLSVGGHHSAAFKVDHVDHMHQCANAKTFEEPYICRNSGQDFSLISRINTPSEINLQNVPTSPQNKSKRDATSQRMPNKHSNNVHEPLSVVKNQTFSNIKAVKLGEMCVKDTDDKHVCIIRGIDVTSDGRIIMFDMNNNRLKLITSDRKRILHLDLNTWCYNVTVYNDTTAIVVGNRKLFFVDISGTALNLKKTIGVDYDVRGIQTCDNNLLVRVNPASVKLISVNGEILWSVSAIQHGRKLFTTPNYITCYRDQNQCRVVLTDQARNSITVLDGDSGDVITSCDVEGKWPRGVTADSSGNFYMCYGWTHEIAVWNREMTRSRILTTTSPFPTALAFDASKNQLIVSFCMLDTDNKVELYQISQT